MKKIILSMLVMIAFITTAFSQNSEYYFKKGNEYYTKYTKVEDKFDPNNNELLMGYLDKAELYYKKAKNAMSSGDENIRRVNNNIEIIARAKKKIMGIKKMYQGYKDANQANQRLIDAQRSDRTSHSNGFKETKTTYYDNGKLKSSGQYNSKTNEKDGLWEFYNDKGQLKMEGQLKNGQYDGEWKTYNDKGQLFTVGTFENGKESGTWKTYYDNGKLKKIANFSDGKREGKFKLYHDNGKLKLIGMFENRKQIGEWKNYHENGQLKEFGEFADGKQTGEWKIYDKTGKLIEIKNF